MHVDYARIMRVLKWLFSEINYLMDYGTPERLTDLADAIESVKDLYKR